MEVSDTGIGIDESRINAVFEDFTQAEMSTTRKYGGTGLGLSIVKKLVELQKGSIDLTSKKNKGTTIVCRIPFLTGDEKQIKKEISRPVTIPEEIAGMKILVVDDEEYNRLLFRKIFESWNVGCKLADNGMEALELLKEEKFDLLFMDMLMPGIDGLKTTRFIREEMKISEQEMPVILISAAPPKEVWEKYKSAGVSSFVLKPFTEELLLSTIISARGDQSESAFDETVRAESENTGDDGKIDLHNLYHISGGDKQFVKQMLESFIKTTEKGLNEMQVAAMDQRWESVADLSHKIQSPCRHIGATDLYNLLNKIEKAIRNNERPATIESDTRDALSEFAFISRLINEHIAKMS